MDYQRLSQELPKQSIKWTVDDIKVWLKFIGLENLVQTFKNAAIDGSCLSCLSEEDLRDQLEIKSLITIKKLSTWIKQGIKQYDEYLKTANIAGNQVVNGHMNANLRENNLHTTYANNNLQNLNKFQQLQNNFNQQQKASPSTQTANQQNKQVKNQLVLKQCDGPSSFYMLKQEGGKIGRHSSNNILILEESVSRYHAEIEYDQSEGEFYLKDVGSTTGTFIKIAGRLEINEGMILEMGSNQFTVAKINGPEFTLFIIEGSYLGQQITSIIKKNSDVKLGRKLNNDISFPDDHHLSNIHSVFTYMNGKIYIQDMTTTNGTWLRLGEEMKKSNRYPLKDRMIFKVGTTCTYMCYRNLNSQQPSEPNIKSQQKQSISYMNACNICYQAEKDCVFIPCKHNSSCIKCAKSVKTCPICRNQIQDLIKIYHS